MSMRMRIAFAQIVLVAITILLTAGHASADCKAGDPAGTFDGTANSPQQGEMAVSLQLRCTNGKYEGVVLAHDMQVDVTGGSFANGHLQLDIDLDGTAGAIDLQVQGGVLKGTFEVGDASGSVEFHAATAVAPSSQSSAATLPYLNPDLPIEQRVDDLIGRMTIEEEASQMGWSAPAIPRLGIPDYSWWSEGLHGLGRAGRATVFPQAIGAAATWDAALIHSTADVISTEARAIYEQAMQSNYHGGNRGLTIWSPNINIFRDPRWGRGQETYGEDPFLTGALGTAFVKGLQGDDPHYLKTVSTPKHFAVHSGAELLRHVTNVDVAPYDLESTYLPAFRQTVTEGKADSVMCAYSAVDGKPDCASDLLLKDHLREAWHFDGYVVSDCGAVNDIWENHRYVDDNPHAVADAIRAGTDLSCGNEYRDIPKAIQQGLLTKAEVDVAAKRLFTARFRLGMFDPPDRVPYARIPLSEIDSEEHRQLALRSARESMTLLKNDHDVLPLKPTVKTIAVIGPEADMIESLEGNYNGTPSHPVNPLDGIQKQFGKHAKILYAQGSKLVDAMPVPVPASVLRPSRADAGAATSIGGLTGEYFSNPDLSGTPVLTRTDESIDFDWAGFDPIEGVEHSRYSVRWTGTITPPAAGDYRFGVAVGGCYPCEHADNFKVYLDDKLLSERSTTEKLMIPVRFKDAAPHKIRVEYSHSRGDTNRNLSFGGDVAAIKLLWDPPASALLKEARAAAAKADVVIACVGISPELESEENGWMRLGIDLPGFYGGDRSEVTLPAPQQTLLHELAATGKPVIAVLLNGSAVSIDTSSAAAVLDAWYPGEEGGTAIAETLAGENNPAGRLPVTVYKSVSQLPPFDDYSMRGRTYRYFKGEPQFGFGFGLSYSHFLYSGLKLSGEKLDAGSPLEVDADVKNASPRDGDEVAELYLTFPKSAVSPIRTLRAFTRVHVKAGGTEHVHFTLSPRDLSDANEAGERVIAPGAYTITVGGGQPGSGLSTIEGHFTMNGTQTLPR
jgi:beta-glucosidase